MSEPTHEARAAALASAANRCFVCGPGNPIGLGVRFTFADGLCQAYFTPGENLVGYDKQIHGGILFSLLDDVMANYFWLQGERYVTARAEVRYRQPVPVGTPLRLEARLLEQRGRLAVLRGEAIRETDGVVMVETTGRFMRVSKNRPHASPENTD